MRRSCPPSTSPALYVDAQASAWRAAFAAPERDGSVLLAIDDADARGRSGWRRGAPPRDDDATSDDRRDRHALRRPRPHRDGARPATDGGRARRSCAAPDTTARRSGSSRRTRAAGVSTTTRVAPGRRARRPHGRVREPPDGSLRDRALAGRPRPVREHLHHSCPPDLSRGTHPSRSSASRTRSTRRWRRSTPTPRARRRGRGCRSSRGAGCPAEPVAQGSRRPRRATPSAARRATVWRSAFQSRCTIPTRRLAVRVGQARAVVTRRRHMASGFVRADRGRPVRDRPRLAAGVRRASCRAPRPRS